MALSFRPVLQLLTGRALGLVVTFFIPVLLARVFDPTQFGTYKQFFLVFSTAYAIAQIGMAECLYYFLPGEPKKGGPYVANSLLLLGAAGLACLALLTLARAPIAHALGNPALAGGLPYMGAFVLLMILSAPLEITMIVQKRFRLAAISYVGTDALRAAFLIAPAVALRSVDALLAGAVAFAALRFAATVAYMKFRWSSELRPDPARLRAQLAYAMPFALSVVVDTAQSQFHQYVVSYSFDAATFAVYSVACLNIPLVTYFAASAADVLMVRMGEKRSDAGAGADDREALLALWHDAVRKLALAFFPIVALLLVCGRELIVILFTETYAASVPVFKLATAMILLAVLPIDAVLRVYAQTRFLLALNLLRVAVVGALIFPFISAFHLYGAIGVTVAANAIARGVAVARIGQLLGVGFARLLPWRALGRVALGAAAAGMAAFATREMLAWPNLPRLVATGAAYAAAYALALVAMGLWRPVSPDAGRRAGRGALHEVDVLKARAGSRAA